MKKSVLFFWIITVTLFAQNIGSWKNYSSMKKIADVSFGKNIAWCATDGGAFGYNFSDDSFLTLLKTDNLSSQFITSIEYDTTKNKVWIGSSEGFINVYDTKTGDVSKIFDINRSNFTKKAIRSIKVFGDTIAIATDFGISLIDPNNLQFIETVTKFGDFSSAIPVYDIFYNGKFIITTSEGIAIQKSGMTNLANPESWIVYSKSLLSVQNITHTFIFNNQISTSTSNGFYQLSNNSWTKFLNINDLIISIQTLDNTLYYLTKNTLIKYDASSSEPFQTIYTNTDLNFTNFRIHDDNYFISTDNGLIVNGELKLPNGPASNSFQNMDIDNDGNLWVGTGKDVFGVGFSKFDGSEWTNYNRTTLPSLLSNSFHNVYAAPDNSIYFLNWGKGFVRLRDNKFSNFYVDNTDLLGIPNANNFLVIDDVIYDDDNNLWILNHWAADGNILSVLTPDSNWFHYKLGSPLLPQVMEMKDQLIIDNYNTKWFVSISGTPGLYHFNDNNTLSNLNDDTWGRLTNSEYFGSQSVQALALDNHGEIWVGTGLGVYIIPDPSNPTSRIYSVFTLRQQTINCIAVDPVNNKWVGTKQGLFLTTSDGSSLIQQFDSKNSPLPADEIKSITFDEKTGVVYIGTDYGLSTLTTEFIKPNNKSKELFLYPNPFVIENGKENYLTIDGLFSNSSIKIISVDGNFINEFTSPGGRIAFWNGKNSNGSYVSSGIYIIIAYDEEGNKILTSKVAVLRK
ncbi:MAG: two-component regulator propeller domain-containing protein [Ignavibacteriales bacterium]